MEIGFIIGGAVLFGIGVILIIAFAIWSKSAFQEKLTASITNEIQNFLTAKNNPTYKFKNPEIENELKDKLKAAIVDQRSVGFRYKKSYINRTTLKDKEIKSIIKKYYTLDQKKTPQN